MNTNNYCSKNLYVAEKDLLLLLSDTANKIAHSILYIYIFLLHLLIRVYRCFRGFTDIFQAVLNMQFYQV